VAELLAIYLLDRTVLSQPEIRW